MADIERKLTTIMCADVAGYSTMMERDEEGTMRTLRAYRATMKGFIERHRGRIANTAGDSIMAEFPSVLEAVTAAAEIQQELGVRNAALDPGRQMQFRIGINLGDVMVEGDDLFGEGVNIAARLESVAEPGGICISGTVHDQVKNKLSLEYAYLGAKHVRNISEEVPVYRVHTGSPATQDDSEDQPAPVPPPTPPPMPGIAGSLGDLGERLGKIIEERVEGAIADDRIAEKLAGKSFGDFATERAIAQEEPHRRPPIVAIRAGRRVVRALGLLAILAAIDAVAGDGWWVQWPAIVVVTLLSLSFAKGVWKLGVLAGGLVLIDWALGGGWWSVWVAVGAGSIITLRYMSKLGR